MNRPDARGEAHVVVARLPGHPRVVLDQDPPPSIDEVEEDRQIHHFRTNILAPEKPPRVPAVSVVVDNDERQRYIEKLISLDLKNSENTMLPI
jgi:hypothetical protein